MTQLDSISILIVDDDTLVSEMTQGLVEELGYTVIGKAANGQEGINLTVSLQPDLVLMDVEMPDMNGLEASRQIQQLSPTPIVILTAYDDQELVEEASQSGVGAYLVKPPDTLEVERAVTIAMARFQDLMELRVLNDKLKERNQQLEDLNQALEERNEELDAYAHMVAHDLKNPLNLIVTYIQYLEMDLKPDGKLKSILETIAETGHKMSDIIESLLLMASIRKDEVESETIYMSVIIAEAEQRLTHMLSDSEADLILPQEWPPVIGYSPWLEEVWVNYLTNAVKYGGRPPRIELGATVEDDNMVRFWIQDNGKGISESDQKLLFTDFTRLDHDDSDGHGLGLSIIKRVVEKLNGQVGLESIIGQGSRFSFTLPVADVEM
ncbi:hybrid sensor histidine kinase/response regulator [Anaerolineales bacterium HSG24]|nr:hybrid sensor histidine kinase/response regulator [Anaerolineales bacterium HSG24]